MEYLLGIDIATTSAKAVLIDAEGNVVCVERYGYPLSTPYQNWSEQEPSDWWNKAKVAITKVLKNSKISPKQIKGIGLTGQMHSLVLLDKNYNILRPAILWNDQRTQKECEEIKRIVGEKKLLEYTANKVLPGFTLPKLIWIKNNEKNVYKKIHKVLLPKDYIRFKLTGDFATDVSDASGTIYFDVKNRCWSYKILEILKIEEDWLPKCYESSIVSGSISKEASEETGLAIGTPVVSGAGDQSAQAVGSGIAVEGLVSVTIGTSGVVFAHLDKIKIEERLHIFCHSVPNKWHAMGVMLSAGGSFKWYKDTFAEKELKIAKKENLDVYDVLTKDAKNIKAGSCGLIFLPYLTGERTPYPDPNARGVFFGINVNHTKEYFTKAVIEGITFGLRDSLELIKNLGIKIKQVRISGGGAKSELWQQVLADIFDSEIAIVNTTEGASYGAAILAGVGCGIYKDVESACDNLVKVIKKVKPQKENVKIYNEYFKIYQNLYKSLKERFIKSQAALEFRR